MISKYLKILHTTVHSSLEMLDSVIKEGQKVRIFYVELMWNDLDGDGKIYLITY